MSERKNIFIGTIQGLRGVAAIAIMLSHYSFFKRATTYLPDGGVEDGQNMLMWIGAMGVSIFIILSGFLAYIRHSNDEEFSVREQTKAQYKRFFPLHFITMILAFPLLISIYMMKPISTVIKVFFSLVIMHAWIPHMGIYYAFNAVSWYLCLVIFFSVMTPLMLKLTKSVGSHGKNWIYLQIIVVVLLQGIIGIICDKISTFETIGVAHWLAYICPMTRFADFLIGGGVGWIYKNAEYKKNQKFNGFLFAVAFLLCCVVTLFSNLFKSELFSTFLWTVPCLIIVLTVAVADADNKGAIKHIFNFRPLQFLGMISFELFLWHQLVMRWVLKVAAFFIDYDAWYLYMISLIISLFLSYFTHIARRKTGYKMK